MSSQTVAVIDACVLYSAPLRDLLMRLAVGDLYQPKWTSKIHEEWKRNLLKNRPDLKPQDIDRVFTLMNKAIKDALVKNYHYWIGRVSLPDPDDHHVLAAAIKSGAGQIVTFNLKDFPRQTLAQYGIQVTHPDTFIKALLEESPFDFLQVVRKHRSELLKPPKSVDEYLHTLRNQQLKSTAALLGKYKALF